MRSHWQVKQQKLSWAAAASPCWLLYGSTAQEQPSSKNSWLSEPGLGADLKWSWHPKRTMSWEEGDLDLTPEASLNCNRCTTGPEVTGDGGKTIPSFPTHFSPHAHLTPTLHSFHQNLCISGIIYYKLHSFVEQSTRLCCLCHISLLIQTSA